MAPPRLLPFLRPTLTKKIGLLLLMPLIGSLVAALVFASFVRRTRTDDHLVDVAAGQRMLAGELSDWVRMVALGQEEDRAGLRSHVEEFGQALAMLQRGGRVPATAVERASPTGQPDLPCQDCHAGRGLEIETATSDLKPQLAAVAALWNTLRPDLLTVADAPPGEVRFIEAYGRARVQVLDLRDLSHQVLMALMASHQLHRDQMLRTLGLIAALNLAVFLAGLFLTRRYIVRPVLGVERAARRIQGGDYSVRLDDSTRDELGTLARTFNDMAGQVDGLLAALDLRRKHAETIVDSVPAWILVLRTDLTVLGVNRCFEEAVGLDAGAVAGRDLTDLLPARGLRDAALEVLSTGEPKRGLSFEVPWKGGQRSVRVAIAGTRLEGEQHEEALLVAVEDVTVEAHLAARTRLLAFALESVADPVCITDPAGAIQYVNEAFSRQNGYEMAEVLGMNPRILKSGRTDPAVHAALWRDLTAGRVFSGLVVNRRKDGSTYEATLTAAPVHMASGSVTHYVSTHRDMTERRQSEEALRRAGAELHALVDHAVFGIYRSTRDGRLLMVNHALIEMLGYDSAEELLALNLTGDLYLRPEERRRLLGLYGAGDRFTGVEADWRRKDGTPVKVRLSGRAVDAPDAEQVTFEVFVEDVTERVALGEQLRQSQKMHAVGELAGGMAHDFNNLLATILVNSELVSAELPPDSPLAEDLDAIHLAALGGAELTRKLLAFGRRQHLELRPVDLGPLVADFGRMMRRVIREDLRMEVIAEEAKLVARADPGAVEQVLMNLVTNARDAMPSQGTLLVQVRRAVLDEACVEARGWGTPGEYVVLEVSDTGVGMDETTKQRIFEPFFTTKPVGAGTGLGMAMVYGLVKQHDGYVDVQSEPGRGTTIQVFLPAMAEAREGPGAVAPPELRGGTETILLAEDVEALRHATKRVLERHGYTVLTAADGAEALLVFQTHRTDIALVISDVVMPRMGGAALLEKLQRTGSRVRFLLTSGHVGPDPEATASISSGTPFLTKPATAQDLLRKVRAVLDAPQ